MPINRGERRFDGKRKCFQIPSGATARERAKEESKRQAGVPAQSFKLLPELGPCNHGSCKADPCYRHCRENPKSHKHELDLKRMGWAKGDGTGRFDVYCIHCGEVGVVQMDLAEIEAAVVWG